MGSVGIDDVSTRPNVLIVESSVQEVDTQRRTELSQKYNILHYDCDNVDEFKRRLAPGGEYSQVQAIVRLGWLKAGRFANQQIFATDVVPHYPSSLKMICCSGHGYDAADITAITKGGIWYSNTPNACTEAVANTATYLVLETFRYLTFAQWCARHDWLRSRELGLKAVDPCGRSLGIVGLGDIGVEIAKKCEAAYGMKIHYHGPRRKRDAESQVKSGAIFHESLDSLIEAVDCVVLAAPYSPRTHHMLSDRQFALKKDSALRVVNIARGKMIDEAALIRALESGKVVGVGLDVHEMEPVVNEQLRENWMVTLLPHIGVCSRTSWANFERQCWDNIDSFFDTGKPVTPVNFTS